MFLAKATPRNLADQRAIREAETGIRVEITDKEEVIMYVLDEQYFGAQKMMQGDRAYACLMMGDSNDKDECLDRVRAMQSLFDLSCTPAHFSEICESIKSINSKYRFKPRQILDQLKSEKKRRTQKAKCQLQRKLQYMEGSTDGSDKENCGSAREQSEEKRSFDEQPVSKGRTLFLRKRGNGGDDGSSARATSSSVPATARRARVDDFERLIGIPAKKDGKDSLKIDGVCAGGGKREQ